MKFTELTKDKSKWDVADHYACFLHNVRDKDLRHREGVFFNKGFDSEWIDVAVWSLKDHLIYLHAPSPANRSYGSMALFGLSFSGKLLY